MLELEKYLLLESQSSYTKAKTYTPYKKSRPYVPYNKSIHAITEDISLIEVNTDILDAVLNILQPNPSKVNWQCMICLTTNQEHTDNTFDNCEILNNSQLLKIAYIKGHGETKHALEFQKLLIRTSNQK